MDKKAKLKSPEFIASKDEGLSSAIEALNSLNNSGKEKKPAKKKLKHKHRGRKAVVDDEFEYDWPRCVCGMNHPPIPGFTPPDGKRCNYYWQLADLFPLMTLHRVLASEIRFIAADKDQSGVLELDEVAGLLKYLVDTDLKAEQLEKQFTQIDLDGSGTLDFTEVLTVIDGIIQRKTATHKIPEPVKDELSKTCSIQ